MGSSPSKISPEIKQPAVLKHYKPSALATLFKGPHHCLTKAFFSGPRTAPVFSKAAKPISLIVQRENVKLDIPPLSRAYTLLGHEFIAPTSLALTTTLFVLQDWTTSPEELMSIINSLHAGTTMRIIVFDIFADKTPFTTNKEKAGVMSYFLHVLGAIEYEFNPEFFLVVGLSCPLFANAMKHDLFPTAISLFLSPVDDFQDYIKFVAKHISHDYNQALIQSITKRLGCELPESTGKTLVSLKSTPAYILLLYSSTSSRETADSRGIQGYFQGRFAGKCRMHGVEVCTPNVYNE
jgi:hypothetical protein